MATVIVIIVLCVVGFFIYDRQQTGKMVEKTLDYWKHLIRLAISAAKADGPMNEREREAITRQYVIADWAKEFFGQAQNYDISPDHNAAIVMGTATDRKTRYHVTRNLLSVMCADGPLTEPEIEWIFRFRSAIQMDEAELADAIFFYYGRGQNERNGSDRAKWEAVLEIGPHSDIDTIKRAYRQKATQLHPDTLTGVNGAVRQLAEDKFKEVNDAYKNLVAHANDGEDVADMFAVAEDTSWKAAEKLAEGEVVVCTSCQQKNRLPAKPNFLSARCGRCHSYLILTKQQGALMQTYGAQSL